MLLMLLVMCVLVLCSVLLLLCEWFYMMSGVLVCVRLSVIGVFIMLRLMNLIVVCMVWFLW